MAFHVFNSGKQLGIVGGGSTNKLPEIHGSQSVPQSEPDPFAFPDEWGAYIPGLHTVLPLGEPSKPKPFVPRGRKGYTIVDPGEGPIGGNPWGGGGGGGTGMGSGGSTSGPSVDPNAGRAEATLRHQTYMAIVRNMITEPPCDKKANPLAVCCTEEESKVIAADLMELIDKLRSLGHADYADCLSTALATRNLTFRCPEDSPFYNTGIHYDDPFWAEFVHNAEQGDIDIPYGFSSIDDLYLLQTIIGLCEGAGLKTYDLTLLPYVLLGRIPSCEEIRDMMNHHLKEQGFKSFGQWQESYGGLVFGRVGDRRHKVGMYHYDPNTGKVSKNANGIWVETGIVWPKYKCKE